MASLRKLGRKARASLSDILQPRKLEYEIKLESPTKTDILRYRHQYGVNLDGIFVLQRELAPEMFDWDCEGDGEIAALTSACDKYGVGNSRLRWEEHWANALSDKDITFLATEAHCTAVSIPIGHYTLGVDFCGSSNALRFRSHVYTMAWPALKRLCARLHERGIGVLIDFNVLPGGGGGKEEEQPWRNVSVQEMQLGRDCVVHIAEAIKSNEIVGCVGIQLCTERGLGLPHMDVWYEQVVRAVADVDRNIPLYVTHRKAFGNTLDWVAKFNTISSRTNPIIISDPQAIVSNDEGQLETHSALYATLQSLEFMLPDESAALVVNGRARQICISEWCRYPGQGMEKLREEGFHSERAAHTLLDNRCGMISGAFFWSWSRQLDAPSRWKDFKYMVEHHSIEPPFEPPPDFSLPRKMVLRKGELANIRAKGLITKSLLDRQMASPSNAPGKDKPSRFRCYQRGWQRGFKDAWAFWSMRERDDKYSGDYPGADRIGALELWIRKRLIDWIEAGGKKKEKSLLEFEKGFRRGVMDFEKIEIVFPGEVQERQEVSKMNSGGSSSNIQVEEMQVPAEYI